MEEMQGVGLHGLPQVHEAPHLFGSRRKGIDPHQLIRGLGRTQMVADRADAA